ncbi:homing endonuclease associated repeat-containing protein [Halosegnis longus]|uniref:homing endonuclease associated repeat-containing protein n=1 Tax=Halosegnis longus TaxID=2216012 RepID=UPI00129D2E05|nr:HNH endonuclease [Halosegnis longus]
MYDDEELLAMLETAYDRYDDQLTTAVFDADDEFCSSATIRRYFGGWRDAIIESSVPQSVVRGQNSYTDEELCEQIQTCYQRYDRLRLTDFTDDSEFASEKAIRTHFETWRDAAHAAGLGEHVSSVGRKKDPSVDRDNISGRKPTSAHRDLKAELIQTEVEAGREPACINCDGTPETLFMHHIIPTDRFDEITESHTEDNCVLCCRDCHERLDEYSARLYPESYDADPGESPPDDILAPIVE